MPRDYKDVWQDAYNSAIEDGKTEEQAIQIAEDAVEDYVSREAYDPIERESR